MSKRRELARHAASLAEIGELLGAMRSLALAESRRIETYIEAQRVTGRIVRQAWSRVLADYGTGLATVPLAGRIVCAIGTERGFCGEINRRLLAHAGERFDEAGETRWLLVGARLAEAWPDHAPQPLARLPGASVADDLLGIQAALVAALTPLLARSGDAMPELILHFVGEQGIEQRTVLPVPEAGARLRPASHPVDINLTPAELRLALLDDYLDVAISEALLEALLHENEQRLIHMEQARRRVDEKIEDLNRRANRARQEEITEEIEIILLAGEAEVSARPHPPAACDRV